MSAIDIAGLAANIAIDLVALRILFTEVSSGLIFLNLMRYNLSDEPFYYS